MSERPAEVVKCPFCGVKLRKRAQEDREDVMRPHLENCDGLPDHTGIWREA